MTDDPEAPDWRRVVAALANPQSRQMFAQVVLGAPTDDVGTGLSASKREHALATLVAAGLVRQDEGTLVEAPETFAQLLAEASGERPVGVERYLDRRGAIDRYPTRAADRLALLELVARRTLAAGEVLSEAEVNERLAAFGPDTARLRRALIDQGIFQRTPDGATYFWPEARPS